MSISLTKTMKPKPNPGSEEAQAKGCACPVYDNHFGKGFRVGGKGELQFWYSNDCKMHGGFLPKNRKKKSFPAKV